MIERKEILEAARLGYTQKLQELQDQIKVIERELRGQKPAVPVSEKKHHRMSAAGRKRIIAAQKKRWAAHKKAKVAA